MSQLSCRSDSSSFKRMKQKSCKERGVVVVGKKVMVAVRASKETKKETALLGCVGENAVSSSSAASNMKPLGDSKPQKSNTAQYSVDAGLFADFDPSIYSGKSFNYSKSLISPPNYVLDEHITAYLSNIQSGGLV